MAVCEFCKGDVDEDAAKCRHCGEWLDPSRAPTPNRGHEPNRDWNSEVKSFIVFLMVVAGVAAVAYAIIQVRADV